MAAKERELVDNEQWHRFEYFVNNMMSMIQYTREGKNYLLMHTEVPPELEGHGVAKEMVEKTFDYLDKNGFTMSPYCTYIHHFLQRHLEWKRIEVPVNETE